MAGAISTDGYVVKERGGYRMKSKWYRDPGVIMQGNRYRIPGEESNYITTEEGDWITLRYSTPELLATAKLLPPKEAATLSCRLLKKAKVLLYLELLEWDEEELSCEERIIKAHLAKDKDVIDIMKGQGYDKDNQLEAEASAEETGETPDKESPCR